MNREIKFRAWDNKNKKWLLGYEYSSLGGFSMFGECMLMGEWGAILNTFLFDRDGYKADDLKVMQYTGLKDKNGKEIYEGDVVTFPYITPMGDIGDEANEYSYYGKVFYNDGMFLVRPLKSDYGFWNVQTLTKVVKQRGYIIGNVHENPELTN